MHLRRSDHRPNSPIVRDLACDHFWESAFFALRIRLPFFFARRPDPSFRTAVWTDKLTVSQLKFFDLFVGVRGSGNYLFFGSEQVCLCGTTQV